ncbi:MAG TPA: ATP-binding protein [Rhodothermales bacterium]|nr:ATP-binding protein [Rhodothermales bacterium]
MRLELHRLLPPEVADFTASILDTIRDALVVLDTELRVRIVNAAFYRLFGVERADTVGRLLHELGDGQWDIASLNDALADLAGEDEGEGEHDLEVSAVFPGLGRRTMRLRARRLNSPIESERVAIALVVEDVTELRDAEAALAALHADLNADVRRATAELAAANEELEAFSYSVSHDLRAPLRALAGFSVAIAEDYGHLLDAQGHDYLRHIQVAADGMSRLIDDLLRLSRLTRSAMCYEPVDLSDLAREILATLAEREPRRRVSARVEEGVVVEGDAVLLRTALQNLLENAWKYTREVPDAHVAFRTESAGDETAYVVADNGAGFDMTYADKLFTPFERLHSAHEFEGSGVGLATVSRVVHRHGGQIRGEGAVGRGATFSFTLGGPADAPRPAPLTEDV